MFKSGIRFTGFTGWLVCLFLAGCGGGGDGGGSAQNAPPPAPAAPPTVHGCPALPASTASPGTLAAVVDASVSRYIQTERLLGMTVAVAKDGTVLYSQGYGYRDTGSCAPTQAGTEYQIGSVTKQFTAAAILQLRDAGKLDLSSTVMSHLPSSLIDARITVRMLLNQTSGLADYTEFPEVDSWIPGVSQTTVITAIAKAPLRFTPGSANEYSNSNSFILGSIIEVLSDSSYEEYLAAHIFKPIALTHTSTPQPLTAASPYTYTNPTGPSTTNLIPEIIPHPSIFFAAGALWSNVHDLTAWNAALRGGRVIARASFDETTVPPSVPVHQQASTQSSYAMGWVRTTMLGRPFVWHSGQTLAYTSFNGMFLDNGFSLSILTNVDVRGGESFPLDLIWAICGSSATAGNC